MPRKKKSKYVTTLHIRIEEDRKLGKLYVESITYMQSRRNKEKVKYIKDLDINKVLSTLK